MKTAYRQFNIGDFQCTLLADGTHAYDNPAALLFPGAPRGELEKELIRNGITPGDWPTWTSDYTCLLIDTGKHKVLIDTGAGEFLPESGHLENSMREIGITPASIDTVVITHAHPDHTGGVALFPSARIIMSRKEWLFWTGEPALPRLPDDFRKLLADMVAARLEPLKERVELIDGDTEILPGITVAETPGHTPGHMAVLAKSKGKRLMHVGDALIHEIHVRNPNWSPLVDVMPNESVRTRTRLLTEAAETDAAYFGFHMPSLGKISRTGNGFQWMPYAATRG